MTKTSDVSTERELITQAVLDYFEGWFDGDVARMERALHPDLAKRGAGQDGPNCAPDHDARRGWSSSPRRARAPRTAPTAALDIRVQDVYGGHRRASTVGRPLPRVRPPRADAGRMEDRERAVARHVSAVAPKTAARSRRRGGAPRRRRAAARGRGPRRHHHPPARRGGRRQPRPRALLLRLQREPAGARARALHREADRAPARAVRGRRPVHREVAHRDAPPGRRRRRATRRSGSSCRRSPGTTPDLRARLARVNAEWRAVLDRGVRRAAPRARHRRCRSTRSSRSS